MTWSSDGFYRPRLPRSVQSYLPDTEENRTVPPLRVPLLMALGGLTGLVPQ